MVEAEFHAVWLSPESSFVDVTPAIVPRILFLPDPARTYEGQQVNNIRVALADNPLIHEFIEINNKIFDEENRGELANVHGEISLPPDVIIPLMRRKTEIQLILSSRRVGRNDPCTCGSGLKYKKCCGR